MTQSKKRPTGPFYKWSLKDYNQPYFSWDYRHFNYLDKEMTIANGKGPGELDILFSLLRGQEVSFTLENGKTLKRCVVVQMRNLQGWCNLGFIRRVKSRTKKDDRCGDTYTVYQYEAIYNCCTRFGWIQEVKIAKGAPTVQ